jgi:hypothetical protein
MKVYKFRKLTSELDYYRLKEILETKNFWCSNFWELNDPMEGVFSISIFDKLKDKISEIYSEKGQYKICSFSGEKGFKKPNIWGYYTDGFKGVAIEVEVEDDEVNPIDYAHDNFLIDEKESLEINVKKILLNKNSAWKNENEYRFLGQRNDNFKKIEKISAIYFGAPYDYLGNTEQIKINRKIFIEYKKYKDKIIKIAKEKKIKCFDVKIVDGNVLPLDKNLWS